KIWREGGVDYRIPTLEHETSLLKETMLSAGPAMWVDSFTYAYAKHTISDGMRRIIVYSNGQYGHLIEIPDLDVYAKFINDDYIQRLEEYYFNPDYLSPIIGTVNYELTNS